MSLSSWVDVGSVRSLAGFLLVPHAAAVGVPTGVPDNWGSWTETIALWKHKHNTTTAHKQYQKYQTCDISVSATCPFTATGLNTIIMSQLANIKSLYLVDILTPLSSASFLRSRKARFLTASRFCDSVGVAGVPEEDWEEVSCFRCLWAALCSVALAVASARFSAVRDAFAVAFRSLSLARLSRTLGSSVSFLHWLDLELILVTQGRPGGVNPVRPYIRQPIKYYGTT